MSRRPILRRRAIAWKASLMRSSAFVKGRARQSQGGQALLAGVLLECSLEARDQMCFVQGLAEKAKCAAVQGGDAQVLLGIGRHEDGRNKMAGAEQSPLPMVHAYARYA